MSIGIFLCQKMDTKKRVRQHATRKSNIQSVPCVPWSTEYFRQLIPWVTTGVPEVLRVPTWVQVLIDLSFSFPIPFSPVCSFSFGSIFVLPFFFFLILLQFLRFFRRQFGVSFTILGIRTHRARLASPRSTSCATGHQINEKNGRVVFAPCSKKSVRSLHGKLPRYCSSGLPGTL